MSTIQTIDDLRAWILRHNPNNVLATPRRVDALAEVLCAAAGRPAWGDNWDAWLTVVTNDDMPGTRANPMPSGASDDESAATLRAWIAADTLTQYERNAHEILTDEQIGDLRAGVRQLAAQLQCSISEAWDAMFIPDYVWAAIGCARDAAAADPDPNRNILAPDTQARDAAAQRALASIVAAVLAD